MKNENHFKTYVLAENIVFEKDTRYPGVYSVEFDWLCPHCGKRHWARELNVRISRMLCLGLSGTPCSTKTKRYDVEVRFPWTDKTPRDAKSVYGQRPTRKAAPIFFDAVPDTVRRTEQIKGGAQ